MRKIFFAAAAVVALAGCQSVDQAAETQCSNRGYDPGTGSFDRCATRTADRMQERNEEFNDRMIEGQRREREERRWRRYYYND